MVEDVGEREGEEEGSMSPDNKIKGTAGQCR